MLSVVKRVSPRIESENPSEKKSKRRSEYKDWDENSDRESNYQDKRYEDRHSSRSHKKSKEEERSPRRKVTTEYESSPQLKTSRQHDNSLQYKRPREEKSAPPHKKQKDHRDSVRHQKDSLEEDVVVSPKQPNDHRDSKKRWRELQKQWKEQDEDVADSPKGQNRNSQKHRNEQNEEDISPKKSKDHRDSQKRKELKEEDVAGSMKRSKDNTNSKFQKELQEEVVSSPKRQKKSKTRRQSNSDEDVMSSPKRPKKSQTRRQSNSDEDVRSSPKRPKKSKTRQRSNSKEGEDNSSVHKPTGDKTKKSSKKHKHSSVRDETGADDQDNSYSSKRHDSKRKFNYEKSRNSRTENTREDFRNEDFRDGSRRDRSPDEQSHNFSYQQRNWDSRDSGSRKFNDSQRSQKQSDSVPERQWRHRSEKEKDLRDTREELPAESPAADQTPAADTTEPLSKRMKMGNINMKTGGAYIPPARLRMMQDQIKDKGSEAYQRIAWEALKKSIVGMTNKINSSNIAEIVPELFKENILRGRGVLTRAIMQAQSASPTFTRVYAALVAIINTKYPQIGELILKRLIMQYKRGFRRNDKVNCMSAARFLAHLLNQEVAHEILILEIVTHLLENPTDDSVEIAIATLKECGKKLTQLTARGMRAITQRVRDVLHEGNVDIRVKYMIEVYFAIQKDGFKDFEIIPPELDLVEEDDKNTHLINLDDAIDSEEMLNVFKFDTEYEENEEKYKAVVKEILGEGSDEEGTDDESGSGDDEDEDEESKAAENQQIIDMTETNVVVLRRKIYLIIQSSLDFEECAHKLLKLELKPGQIMEMCYMILDCCAQQRTYEKFFGLLAQRFCNMNKIYMDPFTEIFDNSYKTIHRLETNKLRNVAKFFAHLLYTDAISWMVLANIKLNEEDTTSSSRIFIKILFQELCEYMGLTKLNERVKDVTLQGAFEGLFPRDHPHNTRFAINFFTSIGLGGLTDELREHLKNLPKNPMPIAPPEVEAVPSSSSSSDSSSSSSSSSSSDSSSSSESEE